MSNIALVVMARYPEAGKTKTRLGRIIGDDRAVSLYRAFLTDLAQRFAGQAYDLHWAYTPPEANFPAFIATLAPYYAPYMTCFPQQGADLGARLLEPLFDVDELPDLLRLTKLLQEDHTLAPATAACLSFVHPSGAREAR